MFDIAFVRDQFPAFREPSLQGQAFLENAGGSYACRQVIDRLTRFYAQRKLQPYAAYEASRLGGEEMDEARARIAAMLGVEPDELSFGPSTSQNTYVLAQAFREHLSPGDAIIVTDQDHEANSGAWRKLAGDGIEIREWTLNPDTGTLDISRLHPLLEDGKVRLVCFPHCSNVVAEINPAARICAIAHEANAATCIDGVSYAPHGLPDIGTMGADIYLFSAYKTYGPHQGVMVIRRPLAEALPNQGHFFNAGAPDKRFTPAGPDHAQVAACAGIADYYDALYARHFKKPAGPAARTRAVHDLMRTQETRLLQPLLDFLSRKNSVRLLGPAVASCRAPTVSIELAERGTDAAGRLARHGIMAQGGDFYAPRPLQALGIDPLKGVLRMSFVHYTSEDEIAQLMEALDGEI